MSTHSLDPLESLHPERHSTIQRLLDGYSSLRVESIIAPLAEDFTHQILPKSLGMPSRDLSAFKAHASGIFAVFEKFELTPESVYEDPQQNSVTMICQMNGVLKGGIGAWSTSGVVIVKLSDDCSQVVEITEFVDSAKALEMKDRHAPKDFD